MSNFTRLPQPLFHSLLLIALTLLAPAVARAQPVAEKGIADMSLEDLLNIKVTTASRKSQSLGHVPAAVFVITAEDIRRSGATSIPEALRLAPGVEVAKLANNKWAVSIRGFNERFANKLLVLMDGRSVYSPLFTGLFWEAEDTLLEDVERIEVIRGPGAALWGSNAVNGVINIISRKAQDTQGGQLTAIGGNQEGAGTSLRYGGKLDDRTHYRVYAKAFDRRTSAGVGGQPAHDTWRADRVGYRLDWDTANSKRSLIAEAYDGRAGDQWNMATLRPPYVDVRPLMQKNNGFSLLGRTEQVRSNGSDWSLRGSYARTHIDIGGFAEDRDTLDVDFQYRFHPSPAHDVMWGWNYRNTSDEIASNNVLVTSPASRRLSFLGLFIQDDVTLLPETLKATVGARLEKRTTASAQFQPNLRLMWAIAPTQSAWLSAARAVRTPSRGESDAAASLFTVPPFSASNPSPFPILVQTAPGHATGFGDEKMDSVELGYRQELAPTLSIDATFYSTRYTDLRGGPAANPMPVGFPIPAYLLLPVAIDNSASANTHGLEVAAEWRPQPWWRLQGGLTLFRASIALPSGDPLYSDNSPAHQYSLRSAMNFSEGRLLDVSVKRVGQLQQGLVPAYTRVDLRYAWKPARNLELAVAGQNLLDARHREFISNYLPSQQLEIRRSIHLDAVWKF
jgi:iron complex outermembrane receptor protein